MVAFFFFHPGQCPPLTESDASSPPEERLSSRNWVTLQAHLATGNGSDTALLPAGTGAIAATSAFGATTHCRLEPAEPQNTGAGASRATKHWSWSLASPGSAGWPHPSAHSAHLGSVGRLLAARLGAWSLVSSWPFLGLRPQRVDCISGPAATLPRCHAFHPYPSIINHFGTTPFRSPKPPILRSVNTFRYQLPPNCCTACAGRAKVDFALFGLFSDAIRGPGWAPDGRDGED